MVRAALCSTLSDRLLAIWPSISLKAAPSTTATAPAPTTSGAACAEISKPSSPEGNGGKILGVAVVNAPTTVSAQANTFSGHLPQNKLSPLCRVLPDRDNSRQISVNASVHAEPRPHSNETRSGGKGYRARWAESVSKTANMSGVRLNRRLLF